MLNIAMIHPLTAGFAANLRGRGQKDPVYSPPRRRQSFGAKLARLVMVWYRRQVLTAQLEKMDDRMLADIGLTYGDIPALVARSYPWRLDVQDVILPATLTAAYQAPQPANDEGPVDRAA